MTNLNQLENNLFSGTGKIIAVIFLAITIITFAFNFTEYAWKNGFKLYTDFVFGIFDIRSFWGLRTWSGILTLLLIPVSFVSFILLITSVITPKWFKKSFQIKYWYSVFIAQILTWILIFNI